MGMDVVASAWMEKTKLFCSGEMQGMLSPSASEAEGSKWGLGVTVCLLLQIFQMQDDKFQLVTVRSAQEQGICSDVNSPKFSRVQIQSNLFLP